MDRWLKYDVVALGTLIFVISALGALIFGISAVEFLALFL
jgi:hypothetical protein